MSEKIEKEITEPTPVKRIRKRAPRKKPALSAELVEAAKITRTPRRPVGPVMPSEYGAPNIEQKSDHEKELVEGVFTNNDAKGAPISFTYMWDGINTERYTLRDGCTEKVPRYIANHVNSRIYPDTETIFNNAGTPVGEKQVMKKRYTFANTSF